jgi:hypothetical protein
MPLAGSAFLALWNDIRREREPEYDRWHTFEHVPERVAARGMRGARRYVDRARERHRYFTLYEAADLSVFESAEYLDLLRDPTPWSAAMRPDLENFVRMVCGVVRSEGVGVGAAVAVVCFASGDLRYDAQLFTQVLALPRVVGCHLGAHDGSPFDRVLLIEALDREAAEPALALATRALGTVAPDFGAGVYDLAFAFPGHDTAASARFRRLAWDR